VALWAAHTLHIVGVAYFLGFLLLDTLVIRRFLDSECHAKKLAFYESAKFSLHAFVTVILVSGFFMLYYLDFSPPPHIWLKISLALTALTLFFSAPYLAKKLSRVALARLYAFILFLAVVVVGLSQAA